MRAFYLFNKMFPLDAPVARGWSERRPTSPPASAPASAAPWCPRSRRLMSRRSYHAGRHHAGRHLASVEAHEVVLGQNEPLCLGRVHDFVDVRAIVADAAEVEIIVHQFDLLQ